MAISWTNRYAAPYAVTPTATHHSAGTGPIVATAKSDTPTAEKHTGNRSLRSKPPIPGRWWLRCQPDPTPCMTKRCRR
jgi:hypothetical protein